MCKPVNVPNEDASRVESRNKEVTIILGMKHSTLI